MTRFFFAITMVAFLFLSGFAQSKPITFNDGTYSAVSEGEEFEPKGKPLVTIQYKSFEGIFLTLGKSVFPLTAKSLKAVKFKNPKLGREISKSTTAYEIMQNGETFYITGLNSIPVSQLKVNECYKTKNCKAQFKAVLLGIRTKSSVENIILLKSVKIM